MANIWKEYKKVGTLGGARHGDAYQVHVLMMLYERAVADGGCLNFRLATEWEAAGKFDDAVLSWAGGKDNAIRNWMFIQVKYKHKHITQKLSERHLFPLLDADRNKGDFSMYKYLASFWDIKDNHEFEGSKHHFVIYTNGGLDEEIRHWFNDANDQTIDAFKLLKNNEKFMKMNVSDKYVQELLHYKNKDFCNLRQVMHDAFLDKSTEFRTDLFEKYRGALNNIVLVVDNDMVRLAPRFIKKKKLNPAEFQLREQLLEDDKTLEELNSLTSRNEELIQVLKSKRDSINALPRCIERAEVEEFLRQLTFAFNQPVNLDDIIRKEFRNLSSMKDPDSNECYAQLMFTELHKFIYDWLDCNDSKCKFLTKDEFMKLSEDVHRTIGRSKLDTHTEIFEGQMKKLRVKFDDCSPLSDSFVFVLPVAIVTSTDQGLLTCLKVYQMLQNHYYRYFSLKDLQLLAIRVELCKFLRNSNSEVFVLLKDNCPEFEFSTELLKSIPIKSQVKLIFLTSSQKRASKFFNNHQFSVIEDCENSMNQLKGRSQEWLLQRSVLFQGIELVLNELPRTELLRELIRDETLEMLMQGETIEIGTVLPELQLKCYIARTISRSETVNSTSNMDDSFEDMGNNEPDLAKSYNEEEFLNVVSLSGNVTVLSSTPGNGKTTLWIKLALIAKKLYNAKWILFVKLSDCTKKLEELKNPDDLGAVIDFLQKILSFKSSFERSLFSKWLQDIPDSIFIFFDGFDELPIETMGRAITLFRMLQNVRVFINTRSHQQIELEQAMEVEAFNLEQISENDQKILFKSLWDISDAAFYDIVPVNKFVKQLIGKIRSESMEIASKFVGVPLIVNMLAEIYKPYVSEYCQRNDSAILQNTNLDSLNIIILFEMFVYHSFKRQNVEKQNLNENNPHTRMMLDKQNSLYEGFVKLHSFLGLMSLVKRQKMHLIIRSKQELISLQEQADRLLDSRIVPNFQNGVPAFIHSSIAEFFAAKCLYEYLLRMNFEHTKKNFVANEENRNISKKKYIKDIFDLYHIVLKDHATVRKFFFLSAKSNEKFLNKLEQMLWCMRPYPLLWACEENFEQLAKRLIEQDPSIATYQTKQKKYALHYAATHGNAAICALLIEHGAEVNTEDKIKQTALHFAAQSGHPEVAGLLMTRGALVDAVDIHLQTPLFLASQAGHIRVVQELMKHSCDVNRQSKRGWNALHIAALNGHTDLVRVLIAKKTQIKVGQAKNWVMFLGHLIPSKPRELIATLIEYEISTKKPDRVQTLFWAVRRDHADLIRVMHKAGLDCNEVDVKSGLCAYQIALQNRSFKAAEVILSVQKNLHGFEYPLHAAVLAGSAECVDILLNKKAEVNAIDKNGMTSLDLALQRGNAKIVELLLKKSAKTNNISMFEVVYSSGQCAQMFLDQGDLTSIEQAIAKDGRPNKCSYEKATALGFSTVAKGIATIIKNFNDIRYPLHAAAKVGSIELLHFLIDQKVDINVTNKRKVSALQLAIQFNHPMAVSFLLEKGAIIGELPLHLAILTDYTATTECVALLLQHGVDPNETDDKGRTALHLAAAYENHECLEILLKYRASVMAKDDAGIIPLHFAVTLRALKVIEILLQHPMASEMLNASDREGCTALHMAAVLNYPDVAAKLIDAGADLNARDHKNRTPLHLAAAGQFHDVVELLIMHQADINAIDCGGMTYRDFARKMVAITN
ncbi:uncharacterized protein LOC131692719 [Topomyia yanbarensis]|uniref:uncharacterized protein LOC131692719 n=1 Tax=Topomyia yanbarensis TaxID=2498891 RepID=UPI00273BB7C5|nr:uncharacterized protein LOC131692719 [Topomyia yanbarensis]XP_058835923.1 uncharacterized protein LOC131692719 [Topomyia yanbarensis]